MELMIVAGILGILGAIALPRYLRTQALAEASSMVLETVAFAEQCAVAHKTGLPVEVPIVVGQAARGAPRICDGSSNRQINSRRWNGEAPGVTCLGVMSGMSHRQARLIVNSSGDVSCIFVN
jgi:type II secretory pathway pseudopilin PulG